MAILLTTDNDSCYIEATNIPIAYVSDGVNGYYKSAFGNYPSFGVALIFDAPTTVTVHNPSASTLSTVQFGNYYLCAYTINWFTHNSYTSLEEEAPYFDNETDFRAWVFTNTPPPVVYNSGGAGSGYIGNSLVSNKKMVGYNVPTSSAEGTKTESVNEVSASAVSGKTKSGNGFARIKFLRDFEPPEEYRQYLNSINGSGFFFKDWTIREVTWYGETVNYPYGGYSYFCFDDTPPTGNRVNYNATFTSSVSPISSVYITSSNNTYSYTITANRLQASTREAYALNFRGEVSPIQINAASGGSGEETRTASFNSLLDLFGELVTRAKNVNIYVDGVLWSSAST